MKHELSYFYIEEKERNELLGINNRIFSSGVLKKIWNHDLSAEDDFRLHELVQNINTLGHEMFEPETNDKGHIISYKIPCCVYHDLKELGKLVEKLMRQYRIIL